MWSLHIVCCVWAHKLKLTLLEAEGERAVGDLGVHSAASLKTSRLSEACWKLCFHRCHVNGHPEYKFSIFMWNGCHGNWASLQHHTCWTLKKLGSLVYIHRGFIIQGFFNITSGAVWSVQLGPRFESGSAFSGFLQKWSSWFDSYWWENRRKTTARSLLLLIISYHMMVSSLRTDAALLWSWSLNHYNHLFVPSAAKLFTSRSFKKKKFFFWFCFF